VGTCHGGSVVTIGDLVTMVNVALGNVGATACPPGDPNRDGEVTVNEVVTAVNNALYGCGVTPPTPPPTSTRTPTPTATQTRTFTRTSTPTVTATPKAANGTACDPGHPETCASGFCTDNVCCESSECSRPSRCDMFLRQGFCAPPQFEAPQQN
jgi:hypothetical protein